MPAKKGNIGSASAINITFPNSNSDDYENIETTFNEYKDYIIINNIELQKDNLEKSKLIKELESTIQEKESEEDKYDNRTRYMKGLLQNLNELKKEYVIVNDIEKHKSQLSINNSKEILKKTEYIYIYSIVIYCLSWLINIVTLKYYFNNYYLNLIIKTLYYILLIYSANFAYNYIKKIYKFNDEYKKNIEKLNQNIKEIKEGINKTEEACLSLDNWICEL